MTGLHEALQRCFEETAFDTLTSEGGIWKCSVGFNLGAALGLEADCPTDPVT